LQIKTIKLAKDKSKRASHKDKEAQRRKRSESNGQEENTAERERRRRVFASERRLSRTWILADLAYASIFTEDAFFSAQTNLPK
jgi:hypothetical protein